MDKQQARETVRKTLENAFDKDKFVFLTKNLLNNIDQKTFHIKGIYVPETFREYVKSYERLGTYTDPEGKKIDLLIVYLQKESSIERARTAQRNFIARYLKERGEKDAGLVAFVSPNPEDWRFSFVKMDYKFVETSKGAIKVKEEFTPAKRYSFLVGKSENSHTAQSRLVPLLVKDEQNPGVCDIEEIFSVEKATKEFFDKYRDLYLRTHETLEVVVAKDKTLKADFGEKNVSTVDFCKKLLGQIVFLYFLQRKGWFGVPLNKSWGNGDKRFLRSLFERAKNHKKNYFNDYLECLFYEALGRERADDFYSRFECRIPFLNGGLFDPINNYDWVNTIINLPNELFSNDTLTKEGDRGDGILDVFDRFNFTVKEDEPLEKEVAVDPEMLGKVFENLLEVKDRKSKGTYYTPREIVHYMCVQCLINYLATELEGKVSKEDLEQLVKYGDFVGENEARVEKKGEETTTYYYKLPESIREHAKEIDNKLADIKVCDPAIGSGAFPVGMMTEIVRSRNVLSAYIGDSKRSIYDFKRHCIHNSLYGVDIDPGAIEIAKLRLWLSLIVDEEDIKQIKPLPNLDYKIMQGNSLLEEYEGIKLFDDRFISENGFDIGSVVFELKERQNKLQSEYIKLHQGNNLSKSRQVELKAELSKIAAQFEKFTKPRAPKRSGDLFGMLSDAKHKAAKLKQLHDAFFDTIHKKEKDSLKREIDALEWDLVEATLKEQGKTSELKKLDELRKSNTKPFFLWKLNFSEVFQNKGGFDVVIANPPYVKEDINRQAFDGLRHSAYYQGKMDLWYYFGCRGIDLLKKNGVICFIAINNWISNDGASIFRNKVVTEGKIIQFMDFGNYMIFTAGVQTMVFLIEKADKPNRYDLKYGKLCGDKVNDNILSCYLDHNGDASNAHFVKYGVSLDRDASKDNYINFAPRDVGLILNKIKSRGCFQLNDEEIFSGIDVMQDFVNKRHLEVLGSGCNVGDGIFVLSNEEKHKMKLNGNELQIIKPYYTTHEISRYRADRKHQYWIIYAGAWINRRIRDYINIKKHLDKYQSVITSVNKPYGLHRTRDEENFLGNKILSIRKCARPSFAIVSFPCYVSRAFMIIKTERLDLKYLLALLNSRIIAFWLYYRGKMQGSQYQVDKIPLKGIPMALPDPNAEQLIHSAVENILSSCEIKQKSKYETQIDQIFYRLYGLTDDEISTVEHATTMNNI